MPPAGEDHRQAVLVGRGNHFLILHRPARLDDRRRARGGDRIEAVAKRDERVRGGHRPAEQIRRLRRRLHARDVHRIHAAHLPGANRQRAIDGREDDGVRLHVRADTPREAQRRPLVRGRLPLRRHLQAIGRPGRRGLDDAIARLHQHGAEDRPQFKPGAREHARKVGGDHPHLRLLGQHREGVVLDRGRNHRVELGGHEGARRRHIDGAVDRDDTAERRQPIRVARPHVGLCGRHAGRHAARVGVLDHRGGRLAELEHDARGRVEVQQVGVRQFLALQEHRGAEGGRRLFGVPCRRLVRILSVAQVTDLGQPHREPRRRTARAGRSARETPRLHRHVGQRGGNRGVVRPGMRERLAGQIETETLAWAARPVELLEHGGIVGGRHHHQHIREVLGGPADQARTTDVDLLDQPLEGGRGVGGGGSEGVQVHGHHVDEADAVLLRRGQVDVAGTAGQDAAVDARMQGFDPAIHHFRESGDIRHVHNG